MTEHCDEHRNTAESFGVDLIESIADGQDGNLLTQRQGGNSIRDRDDLTEAMDKRREHAGFVCLEKRTGELQYLNLER